MSLGTMHGGSGLIWSERLKTLIDRMQAVLIGATLVGSTLAFGGAVWWFRPVLALFTGLLLLSWIVRLAIVGRVTIWKSPLTAIGLMALLLGLTQLLPLPGAVLRRVSPRGAELVAEATSDGLPASRQSISMDRSATLRWLGSAGAGLIVFCVAGYFTDRVGRLQWVWASVLAGFALCSVMGVVQLIGGLGGLYGGIFPGQGPAWAPTLADAQHAPGVTLLRRTSGSGGGWAVSRPERTFEIGSLMGGAGAYLALASLALPLGIGLTLR
ncbi:MAG TPA: O-antigen ligase domain-containing protein, partial [Isosphaeraceae bacterium]|nr:O-antigen ligase domain-containing protein [Isosphaeraceae bacterium]